MNTKYIQIRHFDYWTSFYSIDDCKTGDIISVEFNLSDDRAGQKTFFWLEFFNLCCYKETEFLDDEEDYPSELPSLVEQLDKGEIPFFISAMYYPNVNGSKAYSPDVFSQKTVFDMKNTSEPYYIHIALCEKNPLVPERMLHWLSVLSKSLFGEQFNFEFSQIPEREQIEKEYFRSKERENKAYF